MSYKKALIGFPLITFIITSILLYFVSFDQDVQISTQEYIFSCLFTALWTSTAAAFLIALWAKIFYYSRHSIAAIVLVSICVSFVYINFAALVAAMLTEQSFAEWMRSGGFESHLLFAITMALYSIFVLPFLLPKAQQ